MRKRVRVQDAVFGLEDGNIRIIVGVEVICSAQKIRTLCPRMTEERHGWGKIRALVKQDEGRAHALRQRGWAVSGSPERRRFSLVLPATIVRAQLKVPDGRVLFQDPVLLVLALVTSVVQNSSSGFKEGTLARMAALVSGLAWDLTPVEKRGFIE